MYGRATVLQAARHATAKTRTIQPETCRVGPFEWLRSPHGRRGTISPLPETISNPPPERCCPVLASSAVTWITKLRKAWAKGVPRADRATSAGLQPHFGMTITTAGIAIGVPRNQRSGAGILCVTIMAQSKRTYESSKLKFWGCANVRFLLEPMDHGSLGIFFSLCRSEIRRPVFYSDADFCSGGLWPS